MTVKPSTTIVPELDMTAMAREMREADAKRRAAKAAPPHPRLGPKPTPADRDELLRIWDALSEDGKRVVLFTAVAAAKDEGLPEGDGPLIRSGKK